MIQAIAITQYDEETGRFDSFLRWEYTLPEGYKLCTIPPKNPDFPVFEIRGVNQYGQPVLVGYAARPVARVYEGEILPAHPFGALGTLVYSEARAKNLAKEQIAQMDEYGYGD